MLLRFKVENFLSFDKMTEISMISGKTTRYPEHIIKTKDISVLKSAVIYGANASGKSNLIKAIDFSINIIFNGLGNISCINKNFRLAKENKNLGTFEYEISIDNKYYAYGFEIDYKKNIITEEWLYELKKDKENMIFERFVTKGQVKSNIKFKELANQSRFDIYIDDIKNNKNVLLLSDIASKNLKGNKEFSIFYKIYNWFRNKLHIIYPETNYAGINFIDTDKELKELYSKMLNYFDTGIDDIKTIEIPFDDFTKKYPHVVDSDLERELSENKLVTINYDRNLYTIFKYKKGIKVLQLGITHKINDKRSEIFEFSDESDGTRRLFDLIPLIKSLDGNDRVFIIDEIDRSLHPNLTYNFIKLFLKLTENNSQLLITTHDSNLLDQKLLRRDEIWFVEKNINKASEVYSLDKYKERFDKEIRKAYLNGRYGGIPQFKNSYISNLGLHKWEE